MLTGLSRDLKVRKTQFIGFLKSFLLSHLPKLSIDLIANQKNKPFSNSIVSVKLNPPLNICKGSLSGNIVDNECAMRVFKVSGNQTAKPLLAGSVPQLKAIIFRIVAHIFSKEVNTNGWLHKLKVR